MARYSALLGKRVEVTFRAGDIYLPATGTLAADSGRSIFLEERFQQNERARTFRWELPYHSILRVNEVPARSDTQASHSASGAHQPGIVSFRKRPETA